jgi:hypothetical protein
MSCGNHLEIKGAGTVNKNPIIGRGEVTRTTGNGEVNSRQIARVTSKTARFLA